MKNILLLAALLAAIVVRAQNLKEYKATNGITYHVNDTVKLGKGSGNNGTFLYIEDRGLGLPGPPGRSAAGRSLPKEFTNTGVVIKSIRKTDVNGAEKMVFMVSGAGPLRQSLYIEDAILACEVQPCKESAGQSNTAPVASVADEIEKLKQLMDSGAITKAEYEARKKKLLDQ